MTKVLLKCLLAFLPSIVFCQQKLTEQPPVPPFTIRFNLFGLVDVLDGNLSAGLEYSIKPRISITADLAGVLYSTYLAENKRALGYIVKPALRYYLSPNRRGFIESGFFYKRVGYQMTDWLQRGVVNGSVGTYEEYRSFIYRKRVLEYHINGGIRARLNEAQTLWLEAYLGLSIRMKWQDIKNLPDASFGRNVSGFTSIRSDYAVLPGAPFGVRLAYTIAK